MPTLLAMTAPSNTLPPKVVRISFTLKSFPGPRNSLARTDSPDPMRRDVGCRLAWIRRRRGAVLDWPACKSRGFGLSGAGSMRSGLLACLLPRSGRIHGQPASVAKAPWNAMTVIRKSLSTTMLPPELGDRQRFLRFAELFEHFSNTGELDPAADVPFRAEMNSIHIGTTMLGRCDGTFTTVRRELRQVRETNDDRYCLVRNRGARASTVIHRGREFTLQPGSLALLKLDEPFFAADGTNSKHFTNVHLPTATLRAMVPNLENLVGCELEPGGALSLAMDYSDLLLRHPQAAGEAGVAIANHLLDLAAIGLGARGEPALAAQRGGLRAVRLKAVLMILEQRFGEPGFSAQKLAAAA